MSRDFLLAAMTTTLVVIAVIAALPSFRGRMRQGNSKLAAIGDPLASGIFLGAGLVHMLPEAGRAFSILTIGYPWPYAICGSVALGLDALERLGSSDKGSRSLPLFAAGVLTIHSLLAGAALGATQDHAAVLLLFLALVAHKGAASFSLARLLAQGSFSRVAAVLTQAIFILALPMGVMLGEVAWHQEQARPLAIPVILTVGAGTFLYFGALHRRSDGRRRPIIALSGFVIMAMVAAIG